MSETLEKFGKASANNKKSEATTVKTARQPGESVLSCFDLSSFSTTHPVFFVTYKKIPDPDNAKEVKIINETSWQAKVNPDNNTLTNLTLAPGYTDIGNEVGDCVECIPTTFWANSLIDGLNNSLDNNGKIKPEAVPNVIAAIKEKSITADKIDFTTMPGNKYTTTEQDTGMKWIDGRTIYQKTFSMGGLKAAGKTVVPHGINNLDMVINIRGIAKEYSIGATINLPHAADQQAYTVTVYADNSNINIQTYADQSGYKTSFVTIQYVKKS